MNALSAPLVLEPGDIVRVQASAANAIDVTASIMEQDASTVYPDGSVTSSKLASNLTVPIVCTSSTRPASPVEGQVIYETDTNKGYTYTGAAWTESKYFRASGGSVVDNYRVPPMLIATMSSPQTIYDATNSNLYFNTAGTNTDGIHPGGSANTMTIQTPGIYLVTACNDWSSTMDVRADLWVVQSVGGTVARDIRYGTVEYNEITYTYAFAAGDTLSAWVYQDNLSSYTRTANVRLSVMWLGQAS
jgi:hypothetical protein